MRWPGHINVAYARNCDLSYNKAPIGNIIQYRGFVAFIIIEYITSNNFTSFFLLDKDNFIANVHTQVTDLTRKTEKESI